jgi:integrase
VLNLTVNDVDFGRGFICVQPKKETRFTWRWQVKDKDVREVPLIEELARLLTQIHVELPEGQPAELLK